MLADLKEPPEFRAAAALILDDADYLDAVPRDLHLMATTILASVGHPLGFQGLTTRIGRLDVNSPVDRFERERHVQAVKWALQSGNLDDDLCATLEQVVANRE